MSLEALLARLEGVKRTGRSRWIARCPAHADRNPSLAIRELDDGRILLHDFAGCGTECVLSALGLTFDALFPDRPVGHSRSERHPFPAADVLRALHSEASIVALVAADLSKGQKLSKSDVERVRTAFRRIAAAIELSQYE